MSFVQNLWDGVKSIISGGKKIMVAAGQAAWAMLKIACKLALWIVAGVFTMAKAGFEYVKRTISRFFTPKQIVAVGRNEIGVLGGFIKQKLEEGKFTEAEKELVIDLEERIKTASENNEMLIMVNGVDEKGFDTIAEPRFVKADDYEEGIKNADKEGNLYIQRVRVAS